MIDIQASVSHALSHKDKIHIFGLQCEHKTLAGVDQLRGDLKQMRGHIQPIWMIELSSESVK